jgi:hypothetical protein
MNREPIRRTEEKKQIRKTQIIGAIVLTCAFALFVYWPIRLKSGNDLVESGRGPAPGLGSGQQENVPPPPTTGRAGAKQMKELVSQSERE